MDRQAVERPTQCVVSQRMLQMIFLDTSMRFNCLFILISNIKWGWDCINRIIGDLSHVYVLLQNSDRIFVIKFSALEIYNEVVNDLLNPESSPLRLLDDPEVSDVWIMLDISCFPIGRNIFMKFVFNHKSVCKEANEIYVLFLAMKGSLCFKHNSQVLSMFILIICLMIIHVDKTDKLLINLYLKIISKTYINQQAHNTDKKNLLAISHFT